MAQTTISGQVSRIALRPFNTSTSYIRVNCMTYAFDASTLLTPVLALTEKGDHVDLTFEGDVDQFGTRWLVHITNRALEESAGSK